MKMRTFRIGSTLVEVPDLRGYFKWTYLLVLVGIWLLSGIYTVGPDENGVIRRFGEMVRTEGPGLNYHLPYPIETANKPKVTQVKRVEIGFVSDPERPGEYRAVPSESHMLTGDENIISAEVIVQYKIKNAADYLFKVKDVDNLVKDAAEAVLRAVIGRHPIDDALTDNKSDIQLEILQELQLLMDTYNSGVLINQVQLQDVDPPQEVVAAFKDVASAKEDKNRRINEAQGYSNTVIPKAKGEARKMVLEAEAYAAQIVNRAAGDAERFKAILTEYRKAKDVTRQRLYLEMMEDILPGIRKVIVKTDANSNVLNVLPLNDMFNVPQGGK
jgi:membrane protease subunit HflK